MATEKKDVEKKETKKSHVLEETPTGSDGIGGKIEMSQDVVETIAGLAAREIDGIHALGKSRLIAFGDDPKRGISAEVGQREAALDLEVIIEYGCDIRTVAKDLRSRVAQEVDRMAGRKVVEVNIDVVDLHVKPEEPSEEEPRDASRVR
jgi:uncharacterized alkaline shock family protein YloU